MTKNLQIHVGENFDKAAKRVADAWRRAERGEVKGEDHLTFVSWDALAGVMTSKRFELLRYLHRNPTNTIAELARNLKRDYKRVHEDVEALTAVGLVERDDAGLRADYDEIRTIIAIA